MDRLPDSTIAQIDPAIVANISQRMPPR